MPIDYRSAFCNLALTLFVDHEPFNPEIVPKLCRLMVDDVKEHKSVKSHYQKIAGIQDALKSLIDNTFNFLQKTNKNIDDDL